MDAFDVVDSSLERLDDEISKIRAEINKVQRKRHFLSASLLSTDHIRDQVQNQIRSHPSDFSHFNLGEEVRDENSTTSPILLAQSGKHRDSNRHRVVFSATTFPFQDPSPHNTKEENELLGLRLDLCAKNGRFAKPYYVLFRKERSKRRPQPRSYQLTVHRHTIPAFIPVDKLARRYLPLQNPTKKHFQEEDGERELDISNNNNPEEINNLCSQDLTAFVRHLRRELVAWHLRQDAISWLREQIGLLGDKADENTNHSPIRSPLPLSSPSHSVHHSTEIIALKPTSIEARYARIEWADGRVGRFKISNSGLIERAVVIGDRGRDKKAEDALIGGDRRVEALLERLGMVNR